MKEKLVTKRRKYLHKKIIYRKKCCHKYQHKNMLQKSYIFINKLLFQNIYIPITRYKKQKKLYQKIAPKKTINLKSYTKLASKSKNTTLIKRTFLNSSSCTITFIKKHISRKNILENMHNKNISHVSGQQPQLLLKMANI